MGIRSFFVFGCLIYIIEILFASLSQVLLLLISLAALLGASVMYAVENGTKESAGAFFSSVMLFSL